MPQNRLESHIFPRVGSWEGNFILQRRRERSCKYLALLGSTHQLWGLGPRRQLMNGNMIHLLCEVKEFWSQAGRREGWASQEHAPTSTKAEKTALGTTSINFIFLEASDRKRAREREGRRETEVWAEPSAGTRPHRSVERSFHLLTQSPSARAGGCRL